MVQNGDILKIRSVCVLAYISKTVAATASKISPIDFSDHSTLILGLLQNDFSDLGAQIDLCLRS